jgi:hypothetical protein
MPTSDIIGVEYAKFVPGLAIGTINLGFAQLQITDILRISQLCFQTSFSAIAYPPAVGDRNIYIIVDVDIRKIDSKASLMLNSD